MFKRNQTLKDSDLFLPSKNLVPEEKELRKKLELKKGGGTVYLRYEISDKSKNLQGINPKKRWNSKLAGHYQGKKVRKYRTRGGWSIQAEKEG